VALEARIAYVVTNLKGASENDPYAVLPKFL